MFTGHNWKSHPEAQRKYQLYCWLQRMLVEFGDILPDDYQAKTRQRINEGTLQLPKKLK